MSILYASVQSLNVSQESSRDMICSVFQSMGWLIAFPNGSEDRDIP